MAQIVWRGVPVPWVVPWTAEPVSPRAVINDHLGTRWPDQAYSDRMFGATWERYRMAPGEGEPMWRDIHALRGMQCMRRRLCQVCGGTAVGEDGRIGWLIPHHVAGDEASDLLRMGQEASVADALAEGITAVPPTCRGCWDQAAAYCPNLRNRGYTRVLVDGCTLWGVLGKYAPPVWPIASLVILPMKDPKLKNTLAGQLVVQWTSWTTVE